MKSLFILTSLVAVAMAQRPGYLGSGPVGYPGLASRFQNTDATSSSSSAPNLNNRLGESSGTTEKIPVDARGDAALVNRLNQWPREHRPFWILNAEHIEAQRNTGNTQGNTQGSQQAPLQSRLGEGFNNQPIDDFGNPIQTQTILPIQTRGSFSGSG